MSEGCNRNFEETLLTGYVDGALTQGADQQVRIHLEDCGHCRTLVADMRAIRELTMTSRFRAPADTEWSEAPRTMASRVTRSLGWLLLLIWIASVATMAVVALWQSNASLLEMLLPLGGLLGLVLLLVGVLLDRLKALKTDRYREVQK